MFKLLLVILLILIPSKFYIKNLITKLPDELNLSEDLFMEPEQTETDKESYKFKYKDNEYFIRPLADYKINALIVSHNNISSLFDSYHKSDAVDFKDLCVVNGNSLRNGSYQFGEYSSSSWTCHFNWNRYVDFNSKDLSNIHILSPNSDVEKIIKKAKVGDQISLVGHLVEYAAMKDLSSLRRSSLTRTDSGCEVMVVESAKIIAENKPFLSKLYEIINVIVYLILLILPMIWIYGIWNFNNSRYSKLKPLK